MVFNKYSAAIDFIEHDLSVPFSLYCIMSCTFILSISSQQVQFIETQSKENKYCHNKKMEVGIVKHFQNLLCGRAVCQL